MNEKDRLFNNIGVLLLIVMLVIVMLVIFIVNLLFNDIVGMISVTIIIFFTGYYINKVSFLSFKRRYRRRKE